MRFSPRTTGSSGNIEFISFSAFIALPILAFILGWYASEMKYQHSSLPLTTFTSEEDKKDGYPEKDQKGGDIDISLLKEAIDIIRSKYVDQSAIDPKKMEYGIVRGLVWSLNDPYSEFLSPEESSDFEHELDGDLEGIGAELTVKKGSIVVVSPLRDSPAEEAGLLPEDIILKVDGAEASGDDFLNVIKKIRGKENTAVVLDIFRPETATELSLSLVRKKIKVETVDLSFDDDIAIIEVSQFGTNTDTEFEKALTEALTKDPRGIVLDLRFNSGGYLDKAVSMVSAFQKTGKVVIQKGRPPEITSIFVDGNAKTDLPLVVLQNRGSASASEIVAGALQDLGRAVIVGEKSFGKGTVQELVKMKGGAHLRVTIAKWLTPNGRDIGKVGIEPDIFIERTTEDFEADRDPQMEAALHYLRGEEVAPTPAETKEDTGSDEGNTEQAEQ